MAGPAGAKSSSGYPRETKAARVGARVVRGRRGKREASPPGSGERPGSPAGARAGRDNIPEAAEGDPGLSPGPSGRKRSGAGVAGAAGPGRAQVVVRE
ncbi:hypothetical protein Shyhy02_77710 [Streptomyces hygroscopicus subsp. hygroscopicus]|nr:hypothetical protein Shyhy02_77710 [Streptomyces hygroscopicus subsp. hygroscopicus]